MNSVTTLVVALAGHLRSCWWASGNEGGFFGGTYCVQLEGYVKGPWICRRKCSNLMINLSALIEPSKCRLDILPEIVQSTTVDGRHIMHLS